MGWILVSNVALFVVTRRDAVHCDKAPPSGPGWLLEIGAGFAAMRRRDGRINSGRRPEPGRHSSN